MFNRIQKHIIMIVAVTMLLLGSTLHAAPFQNGSFEESPYSSVPTFITLAGGNTDITGWTVLPGTIDYVGGTWEAQSGTRSIDLNGQNLGGIAQTFDTVIGDKYRVAFYLAGNPAGPPTIKTLNVDATGGTVQSYTFDTTHSTYPTGMGWPLTPATYEFTASSVLTTLSFVSASDSSPIKWAGPVLDNVSVTDLGDPPLPGAPNSLPEPTTMLLLGFGFFGLAAQQRRFTTK